MSDEDYVEFSGKLQARNLAANHLNEASAIYALVQLGYVGYSDDLKKKYGVRKDRNMLVDGESHVVTSTKDESNG